MRLVRLREPRFALVLLLLIAAALPAFAGTTATVVNFDLRKPDTSPFPSNRFATFDSQNLTRLRVNLPKPDCNQRPSDCQDVDVLNTLDGFNVQPRLRIPFSGPIDYRQVNSSNLFLLRLPDFSVAETNTIRVIGINQVVWEPTTNVLYAETDELLEPHTTHLLIVTTDIRDATGAFLDPGDFKSFLNDPGQYRFADTVSTAYHESLFSAVQKSGVALSRIAAASLFTTMSTTAEMEKIRDQIRASTLPPLELAPTPSGTPSVFPLNEVAKITIERQVTTAPPLRDDSLPLGLLGPMAKHVDAIGFGHYRSPIYQTPQQFIPPIATRSGVPVVQGTATVHFTLFVPVGPRPEKGWPVAIYGHGFGSNKDTLLAFAAVLASRGFLTLGINAVGHGGGPLGTITVSGTDGRDVTLPAGGRGFDQNGDGNIGTFEGMDAVSPRSLIGNRDSLRQTVIDLMQLVRILETTGIDLDGDGSCDINSSSLYYYGISLGGMYGSMLLALDPSLRAGASNVGGGALVDAGRLGVFRGIIPGVSLATRVPSLLNLPLPHVPPHFGFNENMPLRNQPPISNNVPGAIAIQDYLERREWAAQTGDALAYIRHVRREPLAGNLAKPMLFQFAKGDRTVPNPTASALIRAGALTDVTGYFRTDVAVAANPALPRDPHAFMAGLTRVLVPFAVAMQTQIADFFATDGEKIIDPDEGGPLFERPIMGPLPETLNFIP